ncbi:uncharacterized protein LOC127473374 isoform X2 [Manacus candei]|uniref:uncharacterized protein LOC127473374 isoform X2 n=1 Tax=Manacus candei TaxID=415023 RepID=UPI002225FB65|nr:uncharacterized protein LOC127473374 isoform X2 [Manacus candei]
MGSKSFLWWHLLSWWNPPPYSILGVGLAIAAQDPSRELQPFSPRKKVLTFGVSGAVGGPARAVHGQQELSVLAPFVWEESSSVFNSETWTGNFSAGLLQANNSPFSQVPVVGQPGHSLSSKSFLVCYLLSGRNPHPYSILGAGLPLSARGVLQGHINPFPLEGKPLPSWFQVQLVGQPGQSMGSKSSLCWHLLSGRNPRLYSILGLGLAISVQDSCKRTTALSPRQESAYPQGLRCSWWASQGSPWAARALCAGTFCLGGILVCIQFWDLDWQFQCRTPASEQQPFLPGKKVLTLRVSGAVGGLA